MTLAAPTGVASRGYGESGRSTRLDVLRGVAIGLVMLRHAWPDVFPGAGIVGVVIFLTLSGYLITDSLHREWELRGGIDLREFFWRRAARLVPGLLLLVVGISAVTAIVDPLKDRAMLGATAAIALTWTANIPWLHGSAAIFHLWTLALEEQFYLVWPWVVVAALRTRRVVAWIVTALSLCLCSAAVTMVWLRDAPDIAYPLPMPWAVALVMGAALALVPRLGVGAVVPRAVLILAVCSITAAVFLPMRGHMLTYVLIAPLVAGATAIVIRDGRARPRVRSISARVLASLGVISYSAYLWNYPLTMWLRPELGGWAGPLALVATVPLAWASYRGVELPARLTVHRWRAHVIARKGEGGA